MSSIIKPLFDRIVVEAISVPTKTASGIITSASTTLEKPAEGIVRAVGCGKRIASGDILPLHVKVGDTIAFNYASLIPVVASGQKYWMIREDDILAIVETQ